MILETLVLAAQRGDRRAFERLYDRFAATVHGILLARAPAREVEDLAQDVFLQALNALEKLKDPLAFGPWISTIARNRATDYHRRKRPSEPLPEELAAEGPTELASETERAAQALAAVKDLPEAYRETLIMRLVEGMTGPEIAASTGLTPGSVRVNLHRGMKLLKKKLGQNS